MEDTERLDDLCDSAMRISAETTGRAVDTWEMEKVSIVFAKICITVISLLRLVPSSRLCASSGGIKAWDLSSLATLVRHLMEAYYLQFYLTHDSCPDDEREFRRLLWNYHSAFERRQVLRAAIPESSGLPGLEAHVHSLRQQMEAHPVFQGHSECRQRRLVQGRDFLLRSRDELSRGAGISEDYCRAQYKYCSNFAHSSPFSISTLDLFRAGDEDSERVMGVLVSLATGYLAKAVRDFVRLFPDQESTLSPLSTETVGMWQEILKWDVTYEEETED